MRKRKRDEMRSRGRRRCETRRRRRAETTRRRRGGNHPKNERNNEQEEGGNNTTPRPHPFHRTARRVFRANDNNRAEPGGSARFFSFCKKIIIHVLMHNSKGGANPPLEIYIYYNI